MQTNKKPSHRIFFYERVVKGGARERAALLFSSLALDAGHLLVLAERAAVRVSRHTPRRVGDGAQVEHRCWLLFAERADVRPRGGTPGRLCHLAQVGHGCLGRGEGVGGGEDKEEDNDSQVNAHEQLLICLNRMPTECGR